MTLSGRYIKWYENRINNMTLTTDRLSEPVNTFEQCLLILYFQSLLLNEFTSPRINKIKCEVKSS
jgi:hypothetical protein